MNSLETAIKHCEEALDMIKVLKQQSCEDMRDATEEERKSTKDYIDSISKPTGLQFDDVYEELDFVQPHKKLAVNLQLCEDAISRESVIEWLKDKDIIKTKNQEENARRELAELPSVTPSYNSVKSELEPCEDCISRTEAIENFASWYGYDYDNQGYYRLLKQMSPVKPQPFINKPCISEGVCREDKVNVLKKIKWEINDMGIEYLNQNKYTEKDVICEVLTVIDKYIERNAE